MSAEIPLVEHMKDVGRAAFGGSYVAILASHLGLGRRTLQRGLADPSTMGAKLQGRIRARLATLAELRARDLRAEAEQLERRATELEGAAVVLMQEN